VRAAIAALHEIRRRIPLAFYGIDFDMLPDGRVPFFEANAAMNLSLSDRAGLQDTRAAMGAAVRGLFLRTAGIKLTDSAPQSSHTCERMMNS